MTRASALLASVMALAVPGGGQAPTPATKTKLTPELAITVRRPTDLQWSPDGETLAFVVAEPPSGDARRSHIWIYDANTREVRQFTASAKSDRHPRWSPDGRMLAFLSHRGEHDQI